MTRTFVALEISEAVQSQLAEAIRQLALAFPDLRWVDPAGIHLTLAFLGELDDAQLLEVARATEIVAPQVKVFSYRLSHLGIFGSPRQPRVIWMGIEEPSGRLLRLHKLINQELAQRSFEVDRRPFSPHLTLARIKAPLTADEQQRLQKVLTADQREIAPTSVCPVYTVNVMKSELLRGGPRYTCLQAYKLL